MSPTHFKSLTRHRQIKHLWCINLPSFQPGKTMEDTKKKKVMPRGGAIVFGDLGSGRNRKAAPVAEGGDLVRH